MNGTPAVQILKGEMALSGQKDFPRYFDLDARTTWTVSSVHEFQVKLLTAQMTSSFAKLYFAKVPSDRCSAKSGVRGGRNDSSLKLFSCQRLKHLLFRQWETGGFFELIVTAFEDPRAFRDALFYIGGQVCRTIRHSIGKWRRVIRYEAASSCARRDAALCLHANSIFCRAGINVEIEFALGRFLRVADARTRAASKFSWPFV